MSQKPKKPVEGQRHTNPHNGAAQQYETSEFGSVEVRGVIETKLPPDVAERRNSNESEKNTRDKRRFAVEITTAVFTVFYCLLTAAIALEGKKSADAAVQSAKIAQEAMYVDQRPWVGVTDLQTVGGSLSGDRSRFSFEKVTFTIRNTGKTPAQNLKLVSLGPFMTSVREEVGDFDSRWKKASDAAARASEQAEANAIRRNPRMSDQIKKAFKDNRDITARLESEYMDHPETVVVPGGSFGAEIGGGKDFLIRDDNHVRGLADYREAVYIVGKITYNDPLSGSPTHTTKFCFVAFQKPGSEQFVLCDTGNSMD